MVPNGSELHPMVSNGTIWHQLVPLYHLVLNVTEVPLSTNWYQGTIGHHLVRFDTIRYHWTPFGTIGQPLIPFRTLWYDFIPLGTLGYHWVHLGAIGYQWVPLGTIRYHWEPIRYHLVLFGTIQ